MVLSSPIPFAEALQRSAVRAILPTDLRSAELRRLGAQVLERSFFSARTALENVLEEYKTGIERILEPRTETREDGTPVTRGMDRASLRLQIKELLDRSGYEPDPEKRGGIEDLSSDKRIDLVIQTNTEIAQGYGYWRQGQDETLLDQWPASELFRAEARKMERDWGTRWLDAAREAGDDAAVRAYGQTGRMVARKDSGVWQALGDGAGGYEDTLGAPYPPFAFSSGMDVRDVDRDDAVGLGLIDRDAQVEAQRAGFELPVES